MCVPRNEMRDFEMSIKSDIKDAAEQSEQFEQLVAPVREAEEQHLQQCEATLIQN